MEFESQRFIVRKLTPDDLESFYDMQSSENVMRYVKDPLNYEESKVELEKFIGYYSGNSRFFLLWAIEAKDHGGFVGICGVYHNNDKENEIAYRLREKYWGQGIGSEVVNELIPFCFSSLGMEEIVAFVDEKNSGSVKILERQMQMVERFFDEKRGRFSRKYEAHN
jgi:ribosomal-protein-alanine N-acetyltransferase